MADQGQYTTDDDDGNAVVDDDYLPIGESLIDYDDDCEADA